MRINKKLSKYKWLFEPEEIKGDPIQSLTIQELVNLSWFLLKIHSAILYGFLEGDLPNAERCEYYLELGKHYGVKPDDNYNPLI